MAAPAAAPASSSSSSSGFLLVPDRPPPPPALPAPPGARRVGNRPLAGSGEEPAGAGLRRSLRQEPGTARSEQPGTSRAGGAAAAPATTKGPGGSGSRARKRARRQRRLRREAVVHFVSARQVGRGNRAGRGPEQGRGPLHVHRLPREGIKAPRGEVGWSRGYISEHRNTASPPFPGLACVPCPRPRPLS